MNGANIDKWKNGNILFPLKLAKYDNY